MFAQDDEWPRTLTDGLGSEVTIEAPPQRIVSASLAVDETLLPLLGPERFAAVTALAQDPGISNVGILASQVENAIVSSDDVEQIIALEPDLIFVASFTAPETIQQLKDAGLTVFATNYAVGLDAVRENIRLLGQAVGEEAGAEALITEMDAQIAEVSAAVTRDAAPVRALYLTPGNYTSGANSTISEIIAAAGGEDVTATAGIDQFAALSDEFIIEQNPDVIFLTGWTPYDPTFIETFMNNPAFADLDAFQNDRVYQVNDAHLTSVSQFIAEGVKDVAAYLYPETYPAFPLTVTDATGQEIEIAERPDNILFEPSSSISSPVDRVLTSIDTDGMAIDMDGIGADDDLGAVDVAFIEDPIDDIPRDHTVVLYPGDTPAANVANIVLVGEALGERVAALNAAAIYLDQLEAEAAGLA